ncbi:Cilia- and flagella-associated protein 57 [Rhizophlyctis rosea]|nr:Cilia- and flagella-associated protein 57 [Rhizophlyctis rosea]
MDQKTYRFIPISEKGESLTAVCVSADRHLFAMAESGAAGVTLPTGGANGGNGGGGASAGPVGGGTQQESAPAATPTGAAGAAATAAAAQAGRAILNVMDAHSFRKRRGVVGVEGTTSKEFTHLAFSSDSKYLIALLGAPDYILHYFAWDKGKLVATLQCTSMIPPSLEPSASLPTSSSTATAPTPTPPAQLPQRLHPLRTSLPQNSISQSQPSPTSPTSSSSQPTPPTSHPIRQITINPTDGTEVCLATTTGLRIFRYGEGGFRLVPQKGIANRPITSHAWIGAERLVAATDDGYVIVVQHPLAAGGVTLTQEIHLPPGVSVGYSVMPMGRGFAVGGVGGSVAVFDKSGDTATGGGATTYPPPPAPIPGAPSSLGGGMGRASEMSLSLPPTTLEKYKLVKQVTLPADPVIGAVSTLGNASLTVAGGLGKTGGSGAGGAAGGGGGGGDALMTTRVVCMAASAIEGILLVEVETNQVFKISLGLSEFGKHSDDPVPTPILPPFHHGAITSLDTCTRKPILATCSTDKSIRIYNYLHPPTCELVKYFPEEAYSVALHPSGLYLLVGFSDKLRLMNVLTDDVRLFREFPVRGCRECRFAPGGHIFAAIHGNMIQLYNTWTFDNIGNLKAHNGKIKSLYFTPDDAYLVSAGMDGATYTWNVREMKRENEHILKSTGYTSAVCGAGGGKVYVVGGDRCLKEITDSTVTCEMESNVILTQIVLSNSGRMMFAGTSTGAIRSIKFPLSSDPNDYQTHAAHSEAVTKLRVSNDDQYLFSAGEDGCLYVFRISDKEERGKKKERSTVFADEILITKSDLEEKTLYTSELQRNLEELKLEHEYQLRLRDMTFNEKLKEITERYSQEIEALKISTSVLRSEKDKGEVRHEEEMGGLVGRCLDELHAVEAKYNQQLMEEYEKFQAQQARTHELQTTWQKDMKSFEAGMRKALSDAQQEAENRLNAKSADIQKLRDDIHRLHREHTEIARQTDEDIETEITLLEQRYERKLRVEREEGARLKGDNGIMRKKFNTLNKDIEDNKAEIARMVEDERKLRGVISILEKEIGGLRKEMAERDELIQDKERRVYDLKKKNQELEKFKFVLDYRIKELKEQVEPRENTITEMTGQIKEINNELEVLNRDKHHLETQITELKERLEVTKKDLHHEHRKAHHAKYFVEECKRDVEDLVQFVQEPALLKKSLENLYKKYISSRGVTYSPTDGKPRITVRTAGVEPEVEREYNVQHRVLEGRVAELRAVVEKNAGAFRADSVRAMAVNQGLLGLVVLVVLTSFYFRG